MDRHAADRTVKRLARRAGINKRISPHSLHSLRHSFFTATSCFDAGVALRDVQDAASHSDPRDHHALRPGPALPRPARHLRRSGLHRRRQPMTTRADNDVGPNTMRQPDSNRRLHRSPPATGGIGLAG